MAEYTIDVSSDSRFPVERKRIRQTVSRALSSFGISGSVAVSVVVVGDRKMRQLNKTYRGIDKTTNVLSFPADGEESGVAFLYPEDEPFPLGDIVISFPQARDQAAEKNILVDDEIEALVVHGVKSLLGQHPEG